MAVLPKIRRWILRAVYPISSRIGKVHMPFSRKKIRSKHYRQMTQLLEPGMGILTTTNGEFANAFIPGDWSHIGGYCGCIDEPGLRWMVEAIGKGVVETDLIDFSLTKDRIAIVKPKFATSEQMDFSGRWMHSQKGKPYDMQFASGHKAFYCSELYAESYVVQGIEIPWKVSETMGVKNPVPQDFFDNPDAWEIVAQYP